MKLDQGNITGSPSAEKVTPASELAARWINEARRHELAADDPNDDIDWEERMLHLECARVLRWCAQELNEWSLGI